MAKARILVVEDESIVGLDIKDRLEGLGYKVVGMAASGEQAIRKAESEKPDLVLMDIKLTGKMDGIEAAQIIQARRDIPVIFLTAFADEVTLQRACVTDSFGYILKPFEGRELSIQIAMAVYKHQMEKKLRDSESRLRTIFASVLDGLFLMDLEGKFLDVNPAGCALFETTRVAILQSDIRQVTHPDDWGKLPPVGGGELGEPGANVTEARLRREGGSEAWVEMTFAPMDVNGQPQVVAVMRDITRRKLAEAALRESEERYSLATQGANDGLWDWNLKTGAVYYSPRWKAMLGYASDDIASTAEAWLQLIHPEDLERFTLDLGKHLDSLTSHFQIECRIRTKKGEYRWVLIRGVAVRDSDGVAYRMAGSQSDVTDRKQAEEQLVHDALHDALTGLPNRALFLDRLERTLERTRRSEHVSFAVLFLDLDRFKVINDSLGHQQGDRVLIELAKRLTHRLRPTDTVARLGGDEFVILLEELADQQDAELVSRWIQDDVRRPFQLEGQRYVISASIGIVAGSLRYERPEDIVRDADIAMYRAKAEGRARHAVFDPAMRERAVVCLELEGDLRLALNRREFAVYYQPILSLETGAVFGFEALLRWFHPVRGSIPPAEFIPVAEECGAILSIGRWVLEEACRQLRRWQIQFPCHPPLAMSVNISGRQFTHPAFLEQIQQILRETELDPHTLKLEITESLFLADSKTVVDTLNRVRELGVQLLIDDFGTGFSLLGYVQHFLINSIKIDRAFIHQMGEPGKPAEIAHTLVHMANELGLGTIAEGIETVDQLNRLKEMDCEAGQGWLFSKAVSPEDIEAYLEQTLKLGH